MAHCNAHLNDASHEVVPAQGTLVAVDNQTARSNIGLGCSSNGTVVACSLASVLNPNLIVYDGDGNRIFSSSLPDTRSFLSAPIVFADGSVLIADNLHVFFFNADGSLKWVTRKPDNNAPLSPVLVGSSIILLAADKGGIISTYDLLTGMVLAAFQVTDLACSGNYATTNTPAVNGNRVYLAAECSNDSNEDRLAAIDVALAGDSRGAMTTAWLFPYAGPSKASPLFSDGVLFFDGLAAPGSGAGTFIAVSDTQTGPVLKWRSVFAAPFAANAPLDPRGGLWVFPVGKSTMFRLSEQTGNIIQTLPVWTPAGSTGPYSPLSAVTSATTATGDVVLLFCAKSPHLSEPAVIFAADVTTNTPLWTTALSSGQESAGQFPIVMNSVGLPRVVFAGSSGGTFFLGAPSN